MSNTPGQRSDARYTFPSLPWLVGSALLATSIFPIFLNNNPGFTLSVQLLLPMAAVLLAGRQFIQNFYFQAAAAAYFLVLSVVNAWPLLSAAKEAYQILHFSLSAALLLFAFDKRPKEMALAAKALVIANVMMIPAVFLFRFVPSIESAYVRSDVLKLFVSPTVIEWFGDVGNNVADPDKAAGLLYMNGNQAAGYFVALGCLAYLAFQGRLRIAFSALMFAGVFATGSKTPLFAVPMVALTVAFLMYTKRMHEALRWFFIIVILSLATFFDVLFGFSGEVGEIDTFKIRLRLWARAIEHLNDYWLFGSGENYWYQLWYDQGALYFTKLPVHNYILRILMIGGIGTAILIVSQLVLIERKIVALEHKYGTRVYFGFAAFMYIAIYSLVENFTIFGDSRVGIVLACCYALSTTDPSKLFGSSTVTRRRARIPVKVRTRNAPSSI
ncbi:O-antigen ligase family protein [Caulobacter sp.]|uniref:O-antigen ligase family protein n=1 Tax=Caulobacter sp. TaxID=78 RepID=UPI003D0F43EF